MRFGKISSGVWLCLALGVFAAAVPLAFYAYARSMTHAAHSTAPIGVPARSLRVISINVDRGDGISEKQSSAIRESDPDCLFLQGIHGKSLGDLQRRLGGRLNESAYYPLPHQPGAETDLGVAILSKFPLEEGRPIPNHMNGACGVWAASVVDGRRFYVACLKLSEADANGELQNFVKAWDSLGKPPILAAVEGKREGAMMLEPDSIGFHSSEWAVKNAGSRDGMHRVEMGEEIFGRKDAKSAK